MPASDHATDGYALALEEARRALDEQERAVAGLSTRAGTLLSAAAIATSFLGGAALSRGEPDVVSWIAIATFVAFCATTLSIVKPPREWMFAMRPALVIRAFVEPLALPSRHPIRRDMALHMDAGLQRNARQFKRMVTRFHMASVLLTIEIVAWVASIATGG
jgi:hypothetical protein